MDLSYTLAYEYVNRFEKRKNTRLPHTQKLVNNLKSVSSRLIRKKGHASVQNALWGSNLWTPSYFAGSCGGASIAVIRQYIEQQESSRI